MPVFFMFFHTQNLTRPGQQIHLGPRIKAGDARRGAGAKTRPFLRMARNSWPLALGVVASHSQ